MAARAGGLIIGDEFSYTTSTYRLYRVIKGHAHGLTCDNCGLALDDHGWRRGETGANAIGCP